MVVLPQPEGPRKQMVSHAEGHVAKDDFVAVRRRDRHTIEGDQGRAILRLAVRRVHGVHGDGGQRFVFEVALQQLEELTDAVALAPGAGKVAVLDDELHHVGESGRDVPGQGKLLERGDLRQARSGSGWRSGRCGRPRSTRPGWAAARRGTCSRCSTPRNGRPPGPLLGFPRRVGRRARRS